MILAAPRADEDVPELWRALGLPGLVDLHTHFMPDQVLRKVWGYFDRIQRPDGSAVWPIAYRQDEAARVAKLRSLGVRTFTSLVYAHRPGMAEWLNQWATGFAAAHHDCAHSATFFPEEGVDRYVAEAIEAGARVFKAHLQVGGYDPRDARLDAVWATLAREGIPVVVHAGSGPEPGAFTGPGPFGEVLERHPDLVAVIAHMGGPEYRQFLDLALRYPNVHLDTTMTFTDFMDAVGGGYPPDCLERLAEHPDRVVLGTDFPNIPHTYAHQLQALVRLGLGEDWLRAVCWDNPTRLLHR